MTNETASLILDGEDVPLRLFEDGVKSFRQLLDALSKTISGGADIEWVLDRLDTSSAITRVRAQTPQPAKVAPVVRVLCLLGGPCKYMSRFRMDERFGNRQRR